MGTLAGCISTPPVDNLPPAVQNVAPPLTEAPVLDAYRLQVGDVLEVKLLFNPELDDQVVVQPDGMISTTVAENVRAYGRTPAELKTELEGLYTAQLSKPHLAVLVRSFAPSRVYVTGEVNNPGEFISVGPNLSLIQAIARAGGVKPSARPDEILILRRGAGEHPEVYQADYRGAVSGASPSSDVRLETYDIVYVPRSDVGDVYLHFQQYFQQFVAGTLGLSYGVGSTLAP